MTPPKKLLILVSGLVLFLAVVVTVGIRTARPRVATAPWCQLTFIDVGQGDAILIQTSDRQDMFIDGGPSTSVSRELGKHLGFGNNEIELAILTHPDADHLTGMLAVVEDWPIKTILTTGVVAETSLYKRWKKQLDEERSAIIPVQAGQVFRLGELLTVEILWPDRSWNGVPYTTKATDGRGGINDTSIGTKISCAGSTALMLGDASDAVELALVDRHVDVRADLLKIGHHGSKYSSTHEFLRAVQPDVAVIQVGRDNRYGHPHPTVLERLMVLKIPVFRTDFQQTLEFKSIAGGWRLGS